MSIMVKNLSRMFDINIKSSLRWMKSEKNFCVKDIPLEFVFITLHISHNL